MTKPRVRHPFEDDEYYLGRPEIMKKAKYDYMELIVKIAERGGDVSICSFREDRKKEDRRSRGIFQKA